MHTLFDNFGISSERFDLMRNQIEVFDREIIFTSLHGSGRGDILRVTIRASKQPEYSYGYVEVFSQQGWVPAWKIDAGSLHVTFSDLRLIRDEDLNVHCSEKDRDLLVQIGAEIVTLSKAGGRL